LYCIVPMETLEASTKSLNNFLEAISLLYLIPDPIHDCNCRNSQGNQQLSHETYTTAAVIPVDLVITAHIRDMARW
jgi:hypothetical protein